MVNREIQQAAYQIAKMQADASGEVPGLDAWWSILKEAESAEVARLIAEEESAADEDESDADLDEADQSGREGIDWGAFNKAYYGKSRWSRAHAFRVVLDRHGVIDHDLSGVAVCGVDPGPDVEWANEDDVFVGRCRRCLCKLGLSG